MTTVTIHGRASARKGIRAILQSEAESRPISWTEQWRFLSSTFAVTGSANDLFAVNERIDYYLKVKA